ncbi:MAG TPA: alpha/beta fold hydrolase [Acetobacteraceae bacterium]|jgi:3-oxoadipate enol-lactonase|nr:alpha/beta fold hydrolase [Acetobacteraceae bacterium]
MTERTLHRRDAPTLRYRDKGGDRPPVVLIHGVGADGSSWDDIASDLAADFRVLCLDLRGHGQSGHIEGTLTLDDFVRDVVDVLDACAVPAAHVVGFSLGGMIAQGIALHHADRVRRLVLLSAVAGRTAEERERVQQRLAVLQEQGIAAITGAAQERWFTPGFIARNPALVQQRMQQLQENHAPSYAAAYTVFSTSDLGEKLHAIRIPTLIATGEHDVGSRPRMARCMHAQIAGSRLAILPGLRHSILVEAPDLVVRLVREFLCGDAGRREG